MKNDLSFLLELKGFGGEALYDCAMSTFELFRDEYYEFVHNAARMFYECFIINFVGGDKYCEIDEYGNPNVKATIDKYFYNHLLMSEDKDFYYQIFKEDWRIVNCGSHYRGDKDYEVIKDEANDLLYNIATSCEYFYRKKAGKYISWIVDVAGLKANSSQPRRQTFDEVLSEKENTIRELNEEINKLKFEMSELKAKHETLKANAKILKTGNSNLQQKYLHIKTLYEDLKSQQGCSDAQLEEEINELLEKLAQLEKDNSELSEENTKLENNNKNLEAACSQLEKECDELRTKCKELQGTEKPEKTIIAPKETITHMGGRLEQDVLDVVKYMYKLGCFATVTTIRNIFRGVKHTPQIACFPDLKKCPLYGTQPSLSCEEVNNCIDTLILNNKICKKGGKYEPC